MSNNLRQAAQQALEALEWAWGGEPMGTLERDAITALRAALAEPEQEPCAMRYDFDGYGYKYIDSGSGSNWQERIKGAEPLFTAPPQPEQDAFCDSHCTWRDHHPDCVRAEPEQPVAYARDRGNPCYMFTASPSQHQPEQEPVAELRQDMKGGGYVHWLSDQVFDAGTRLYTAPPQREHITDGSPCWCNPDVIEEDGGNVIVHNYDDNWQQYAKPGETAQQCIERHRAEQDALMKLYATPRKSVELTDEQCDSVLLALDEWAKRFDHYDYGLPLYNEELRAKAREVMRIAHGITGDSNE